MRSLLLCLAFMLTAGSALADRPLTQEESERVQAALKEQGCSGDKMEFDDHTFEVERATCADGKTYDLDFDNSFRLIKKKLKSGQAGNGPGGKSVPKLVLFMVIDGFPQEQFVKYYDQYTERVSSCCSTRAAGTATTITVMPRPILALATRRFCHARTPISTEWSGTIGSIRKPEDGFIRPKMLGSNI
jgi:hypothetical protein